MRIGSEWRDAYAIMEVSDVGTFAGSLNGPRFSGMSLNQLDYQCILKHIQTFTKSRVNALSAWSTFEYVARTLLAPLALSIRTAVKSQCMEASLVTLSDSDSKMGKISRTCLL